MTSEPNPESPAFIPEVSIVQSYVDHSPGPIVMADLKKTIKGLEEANPYIGRDVRLWTLTDMDLIRGDGTSAGHIPPGEAMGVFKGFFMTTTMLEDGNFHYSLGVEMEFNEPGKEDIVGQIDAEAINDIGLIDGQNPFKFESSIFHEAEAYLVEAERQYPQTHGQAFMEWYVDTKINATSLLIGSVVELLFCETVEYESREDELLPPWLDDTTESRDEDHSPVEYDPEETAPPTNEYRGEVEGIVIDFGFGLEPDEGYYLNTLIELHPLHVLSVEEDIRYIRVPVDAISWGRVIGGPSMN